MTNQGGSTPPPGWIPTGDGNVRYWDGQQWTDNIAPAPPAQSPSGFTMPDDNTYALLLHLSAFIAPILGPLVLWLINQKRPFVDAHGKAAVNFQLTMLIASLVSFVLAFFIIGIFLLIGIAILSTVASIIAAVKANNGELYTYPLAIPFLR